MEFIRYLYVVTVAEQQSFSRAAEKLYVSQPALTKSISKLEYELGVKLFDRSSNPVKLTYAGERYTQGMKKILDLKGQLDKEMGEIAAARSGRLNVGIPESRSAMWLSRILPAFISKHPGIDIRVTEGTSGFLEKELAAENIDICVVLTLPLTMPGIGYELIGDEQLMVVVPPGHAILNGAAPPPQTENLYYIEPSRLDGQPYVSLTPDHGLYRTANQMFERYNISPKKVIELSNTKTAFYLASQGMGFTIMPLRHIMSSSYEKRPVFCTISDPPLSRSIVAAYKKGRELPEPAKQFIETARLVAENPAVKSPVLGVSYWE